MADRKFENCSEHSILSTLSRLMENPGDEKILKILFNLLDFESESVRAKAAEYLGIALKNHPVDEKILRNLINSLKGKYWSGRRAAAKYLGEALSEGKFDWSSDGTIPLMKDIIDKYNVELAHYSDKLDYKETYGILHHGIESAFSKFLAAHHPSQGGKLHAEFKAFLEQVTQSRITPIREIAMKFLGASDDQSVKAAFEQIFSVKKEVEEALRHDLTAPKASCM